MHDLERYREDHDLWSELAYKEAKSDERGSYDLNERKRYKVLLDLQYNRSYTDQGFIRYLFDQEIKARENDSFQGVGKALWLVSYLALEYNSPDDIKRFIKAKYANFDTYCGFDIEFVFYTLREKTLEYIKDESPDLFQVLEDRQYSDEIYRLDNWWREIKAKYPSKVDKEDPIMLFERYIYFREYDKARVCLEEWHNNEPDSDSKRSYLKYSYKELGDYEKVAEYQLLELNEVESHWDRVSCFRDLVETYTCLKDFDSGLKYIDLINREFILFSGWKGIGLGRMTLETIYEFSNAVDCMKMAKHTFETAHKWQIHVGGLPLNTLIKGLNAAKKCSSPHIIRSYEKLVKKEEKRIQSM